MNQSPAVMKKIKKYPGIKEWVREHEDFDRRKKMVEEFHEQIGIDDVTVGEILALPKVLPSLREKIMKKYIETKAKK